MGIASGVGVGVGVGVGAGGGGGRLLTIAPPPPQPDSNSVTGSSAAPMRMSYLSDDRLGDTAVPFLVLVPGEGVLDEDPSGRVL